ncbi:hypothetical protein DFQ30_005682 [Apophysomyces sp. BC1015]|nr:hypothetical protein DFQ30_005682 [Apophysomyces sp. BC1015]
MANSRILVTGGGDSSVKIWDLSANGSIIKTYQTLSNVNSLTVHEDTMTLAAGTVGAQGIVHVWRP